MGEEYKGVERRQNTREFCQAHIPMTNAIVEMKTMLANIEKGITQGINFKTAMVGSIVLIVLTIIGQGVLYGRLLERVDGMKTTQAELRTLQISQAEDRKQIEINTQRWNRLLEKNPIIVRDLK